MDNLNKQNFWNELHAHCPDAMGHFSNWVDSYMKEIAGTLIFNHLKFHDLPFEIQNGIIARYQLELEYLGSNPETELRRVRIDYRNNLRDFFKGLQREINQGRK